MSSDLSPEVAPEGRTSLHLLAVAEATRQLNICNSCRYCEGLCAVFPALERRNLLDAGDVSQLANLCHDCRACYDDCMYSPPHPVRHKRAQGAVRRAVDRLSTSCLGPAACLHCCAGGQVCSPARSLRSSPFLPWP